MRIANINEQTRLNETIEGVMMTAKTRSKAAQNVQIDAYLRANPNETGDPYVEVCGHFRSPPRSHKNDMGTVYSKSVGEVFHGIKKDIKGRIDALPFNDKVKRDMLDKVLKEAPAFTDWMRGFERLNNPTMRSMAVKNSEKIMGRPFTDKVHDEASKAIKEFEETSNDALDRMIPEEYTERLNKVKAKMDNESFERFSSWFPKLSPEKQEMELREFEKALNVSSSPRARGSRAAARNAIE